MTDCFGQRGEVVTYVIEHAEIGHGRTFAKALAGRRDGLSPKEGQRKRAFYRDSPRACCLQFVVVDLGGPARGFPRACCLQVRRTRERWSNRGHLRTFLTVMCDTCVTPLVKNRDCV